MIRKILKLILYSIIIFALYIFIRLKLNDYNAPVCYHNIQKVKVGDDLDEALSIMDKGLFFKKRIIESVPNYIGDTIHFVVIYPYEDRLDPASSYPKIYYDNVTKKVIKVRTGIIS